MGHLHEDSALKIDESKALVSHLRTAIKGTLLNALNPKLSLFFLAFRPQFRPAERSNSLAILALILMAMAYVIFIMYGAFASTARTFLLIQQES
jgi:threonine/homoserine/homoserine lactone efflux protein